MSTLSTTLKNNARTRECALVFDGQKFLGGGSQGFGYPLNHRATFFIVTASAARRSYVGIRIYFPTKVVPHAKFSTTHGHRESVREVVIMLLPICHLAPIPREGAKLAIFRFRLKDGDKASIEGFGMPIVCESEEDQAIFDGARDGASDGAPVDGVMSLRELCLQREFVVMVQGFAPAMPDMVNNQLRAYFFTEEVKAPFPYVNGDWDLGRYAAEINGHNGKLAYESNIRFDNPSDCAVAISHSVVQDVFHLIQDVHGIRELQIECEFLRLEAGTPDSTAREFVVLVWHHIDKKFEGALAQLLKGGTQLGLAFSERGQRQNQRDKYWSARLVPIDEFQSTGANFAMRIRRPYKKSDTGKRDQPIQAFDEHDDANKVTGDFYLWFDDGVDQSSRRVAAVQPLWQKCYVSDKVDDAVESYTKATYNTWKAGLLAGSGFPSLVYPLDPPTKLKAGSDDAAADAKDPADAIANAMEEVERVRNMRSLPKVDIFQFKAGEKYDQLQELIKEGVGRETYGRFEAYAKLVPLGIILIVGFAGSGKTQMVSHVALLLIVSIGPIFASGPTHVATTNFAERLFRLSSEVADKLGWERLLIIRGYNVQRELAAFEQLSVNRSATMAADEYGTGTWEERLSCCWWMLKVVGAKGYDLAKGKDPAALFTLRKRVREDPHFKNLRGYFQGNLQWNEKPNGKDELEPCVLAEELLKLVVANARAVCTTPHACRLGNVYHDFNVKKATGVVLDEAGAMHAADALHIWGWGCRPCVMSGDPKQLQPCVMTHGLSRGGKCMSMFSLYGRLSLLERLEKVGWPSFELNTQYRHK